MDFSADLGLASAPSSEEAGGRSAAAPEGPPFVLIEPLHRTAPLIFASPHSGRIYPPSFLETSRLDALSLRYSEDAFVDELFACAPAHGAPLIAAEFPRAFVDANRAAGEIDPSLFDVLPALPMAARTVRVAAGLGVIPRVVREGLEIYRGKLPGPEAAFRLDTFYRPYHAALSRLVEETRTRFGAAIVVDCHSMPSSARAPDVVIGDYYGEAAAAPLAAYAMSELRKLGFNVGYNTPYAGGHTTLLYGRPREGLHALQIEINRALYLDERRIEKLPVFDDCMKRIETFIARLVAADASLLAANHQAQRERA